MSATSSAPEVEMSEHGGGWILFAGIMLAIVGMLNVIYGVAAIGDAHVYVGNQDYVFGDLNLWGWFLVVVGTVQFAAALGILNRAQWARWVGILSAAVNSVLQLLWLPAFPFLALTLFAVDVLVLYGLVAYGGRVQAGR